MNYFFSPSLHLSFKMKPFCFQLGAGLLFLFWFFTPPLLFAQEWKQYSGVYPHLAMYNKEGECGTGAVVPWADRLWVITYGPHKPFGSSDLLYEIDSRLHRTIRPESVGGTPANRMIHRESNQLFIGPYVIDSKRNVRVIPPKIMPGRLTGTARHLTDPRNKVYFATMEEGFYEVDVHTLAVCTLHPDGNATQPPNVAGPLLPGYHGKGLYTSQGRLIYANNGEYTPEARTRSDIISGCLAEWDGNIWNVVMRHQFNEVTGPGGIYGNADDADPVWATGWDDRSLLLMLLDKGRWYTFRLPKASHTYDGSHGWFTEWPRIRDIGADHLLMNMHGMFFAFPKTFSNMNRSGVRPLSTYLKIIGDFCEWNGRIIFGCDDAAKSGFQSGGAFQTKGTMCGQSNSNLWFMEPDQLQHLGPVIGRGGPWKKEAVQAGVYSAPFLFAGFDQRMVHIQHTASEPVTFTFEIDAKGNQDWTLLDRITVPSSGYAYYLFDSQIQAEWIRVKTNRDCKQVTLTYQFADHDNRSSGSDALFKGLARSNEDISYGIIRPRGNNLKTLQLAASHISQEEGIEELGYYEIGENMKLIKGKDPQAHQWMKKNYSLKEPLFQDDGASLVITDSKGNRFRLPRGSSSMQKPPAGQWPRTLREVVTERSLFQCEGNLFELPRNNAGGFAKIRPVASSSYWIMDMCSWRGMLVISGIADNAPPNPHIIRSDDGNCALWFGVIDDLWKLGKPRGVGGPWNDTPVQAHEPSDPYLMTGYDHKVLTLRHQSDQPITFQVEIDITGDGDWVLYDSWEVKPNQTLTYSFPDGFNAYWVRLQLSAHTTATAQFRYD